MAETIIRKDGITPSKRRARKQLRRRLTWLAIALVLIGGGTYWYTVRNKAADKGPDLQTATAFRTTLVETVSATGSVTAQTGAQVKIGSQITGRIKRLYADVGSHVQAGQLIAVLDLPDIEAQVQQAQANLAQARTKLQQQLSGVGMQQVQTSEAVRQAQDALRSAQAKLNSAIAAATMSPHQTTSDIRRAQAGLGTAQAQLNQVQKSHALQIGTAQAQINQAQANYRNAATELQREQKLFKLGYIAASDLDTAQTQADVMLEQLNTAKQNLSLVQAKADSDVETARQQVDQATASLAAAKSETYNDVMRQQDVQNARAAVQQAASSLAAAKANTTQDVLKQQDVEAARQAVEQAQAQVDYQQAQYAKTFIRSPISGTVLQMAAQQGETLAAGLSAPTLIIVADLDRLQVDAFVDETDIGKVKLGQSATVTVDAFPDQQFSGKVTKIASGSTLQQNVVTYDVTVAIDDTKHLLKPDMTASVNIAVGVHPDVVAVPNEAVKQDNTGTYVYVVPKPGEGGGNGGPGAGSGGPGNGGPGAGGQPGWNGGRGGRGQGGQGGKALPQRRPVKTGATDGTYTEIKSGVDDGDTVVLAGWPPPEGFNGVQVTPFGMRPTRGGGGGGRKR